MSATRPILAVYDADHAAGAVAGTDSPGAAGPARSIRGVVRRWMPRAGAPVADRRKQPRVTTRGPFVFQAQEEARDHAQSRLRSRGRAIASCESPGAQAWRRPG